MSIRAFQGTCLHCGHDHDAANEAFRKSLETVPLPSGTIPASEGGAPSRELLRQARVILLKAWERSGQGALGPIAMILADLEAECDGKRSPRSATAPIDAVPFEKIIGVTRAFDHIDGTEVNIPWVRVFFPDDDWESRDRFAKAIAAIADGRNG